MVRTSTTKVRRAIKLFIKHGIPFTLKRTNQRLELTSKFASYSNKESELPPHELYFVRKVRDSIIKQELYKTVKRRFHDDDTRKKKIKYFFINPKHLPGDFLEDCVEIDLKSAYWETAYRMGLLIEDIYQQGKTISKTSRLAAIGSLAKVTRYFEFDGKEEREILPAVRSELTEHLWDEICYRVGKLAYKASLAAGKDFVFVWVDAMFIRKSALPKVKRVIDLAGYEYSVDPCQGIWFHKSEIIVKGKGKWVRENGKRLWKDEREFSYSVGKELTGEKAVLVVD